MKNKSNKDNNKDKLKIKERIINIFKNKKKKTKYNIKFRSISNEEIEMWESVDPIEND